MSANTPARFEIAAPGLSFSQISKDGSMLVLSRKPGEKILIGDQVEVTIVRIGPNTVRLGIKAPRDMNIVREELAIADSVIQGQANNDEGGMQ